MTSAAGSLEFKVGVAGGTLLSAIVNIPGTEIVNAMILATVGAVTSFIATFLCKKLVEILRRKVDTMRRKGPS